MHLYKQRFIPQMGRFVSGNFSSNYAGWPQWPRYVIINQIKYIATKWTMFLLNLKDVTIDTLFWAYYYILWIKSHNIHPIQIDIEKKKLKHLLDAEVIKYIQRNL